MNGIDISNHNWPIRPADVPGQFVIMRASEGQGMRDEHFAEYDAQVRPSAKLAGAYHLAWIGDYTGVKNTPQAEAANFADAVKASLRPGFLLVLDWEAHLDDRGRTVDHTAQVGWAVAWAKEVQRLTGRTPILYANWSTLNRHDWTPWRTEIGTDYWLAGGTGQYDDETVGYAPGVAPPNPKGWGDPFIWQYTEYGYLPGWSKRLDLNTCNGDWNAVAGRNTVGDQAFTIRGFAFDEASYWWFRALEDVARYEGLCKADLDLYQTKGGSPLSGGTHVKHGAQDFWQSANPRRLTQLARYGGGACWDRGPAQGFTYHKHNGIKGLGDKPYNYQIAALEAGYNGLGYQGRGGRDDGPRGGIVTWPLPSYSEGLRRLRALVPEPLAKIVQPLRDFFNGWLAVDAWDPTNPDDVTLYGMSDETLAACMRTHGYTFYDDRTLHERMRYALADFVTGRAGANANLSMDALGWVVLNELLATPDKGVTYVELRPVFSAAHAGGDWGAWGEKRTRHSVRTVQEGLVHYGAKVVVDGIYGPATRAAVADWQVGLRGARKGTQAANGVVGVHDFLHLAEATSQRIGNVHRARFLY